VALVGTLVAFALLWVRLRRPPASTEWVEVECDHPVPTRFELTRPWWLPLCDVRWTWVSPPADVQVHAERGRLHERVIAARRCAAEQIVRRISVEDGLGLTRITFEHRQAQRVRFLPSTGALGKVDVVRGMAGGDDISHPEGPPEGDLYDLRHYTPGDPIRFVLWSVFARSRQLVIRTHERALSVVRHCAAYQVSGPADEPAAGAARLAIEQGILGEGWMLGADGTTVDAKNRRDAMDVLTRSASMREGSDDAPGSGLGPFLARATQGMGRVVVFVPGRPGPWLDRVRQACARHSRHLEVFICIDGIAPAPSRAWWARPPAPRVATVPPPSVTQAEIAAVLRGLAGVASRVRIIDRAAGRMYGEGHLSKLAG
jgi:hypothetical protein